MPPDTAAYVASDSSAGPASVVAEPVVTPPIAPVLDTGVVPRVRHSEGDADPQVSATDVSELDGHHLLIPVAGIRAGDLRDSFTERRGERVHNALDIMAPRGTAVLSADDGTVLKLHSSKPGGLTVYTSDAGSRFIFLYGHLDSFHPGLKEGAMIRKGDTIGRVGSTGNAAAAGPHLHFAISRSDNMSKWWRGTPLNPYPLLR